MSASNRGRPQFLAPEVVQTSAMDCGPAALKCLLDGFGLHASYGRLREACQTDVDGTSIDTLEDLANEIGLVADQIIVPIDHAIVRTARVLPAIVVVRQPGGLLHFVVAWRRHGPVVQLMDPATGRRWPRCRAFADELYSHTMPVPADAWRRSAESDLFQDGVRARAKRCGIDRHGIDRVLRDASDDVTWRSLAALDSTLRMVTALRRSGGIGRGEATHTLQRIWERACLAPDPTSIVPDDYWTVRPREPTDDVEQVLVRGAVLVRVRGRRAPQERMGHGAALPKEVAAAMHEAPAGPSRHLQSLLRADGWQVPTALLLALLLAAAGVVAEALLFRSLIDLGGHLPLRGQRLAATGAIISVSGLLLALEVPIAGAALSLGRRLELRLRMAFLRKIPRLTDRYLQSRPSSDMAQRAQTAHQIRELPTLATQLARSVFELAFTTLGIGLLFPGSALCAITAAVVALAVPAVGQPWLRERDLRQRTHTGALTRFYLDAFLGLVPVRAHGAERALAREQESLLVDWAYAGRAVLRMAVATSGVQLAVGFGLAAWLLFARARLGDEGSGALLLAYWALNIPMIGQEIAQIAWQYPIQRNLTLRLLEPLGALEEEEPVGPPPVPAGDVTPRPGVRIEFRHVSVHAGGHGIIHDATMAIRPGAHVAVVGASGAGKSTLAGLLLGWHRASSGAVMIDDEPLDGAQLDALRRETVWMDPAVQLWNRSLADNLDFGLTDRPPVSMGVRVADAELRPLIERLPEGLQTFLGEGGGLVSGGEGQRVRFGRGLGRPGARLVILDEPFRGLERARRALLLRRARLRWHDATVVCVTHDISETSSFDRVIVLAHGRIVEDDAPAALAGQADSRYRALLDAEIGMTRRLWADSSWRTLSLDEGVITGDSSAAGTGLD